MSMSQPATVVRELALTDIVAIAQCIVIDAEAFPYASVTFGFRPGKAHVWTARGDESRQVPRQVPGRVLGFVSSIVRGHEQYIEALAVERGSRRHGIGRALLTAAMDHASKAHLGTVRLHVWVNNRSAVELYLSSGFVERSRARNFYRPGLFEGSNDAYEMAWTVDGTR
jgi:ribosomal protein S18 acetylase RimI-like enzyme